MSGGARLGVADVRRIAELARLSFGEEELDAFSAQLAAIVDYVGVLQGADVPPAEGLARSRPTPLREDAVTNPSGFDVADELLAGAPARDGDLIVVPRVIE